METPDVSAGSSPAEVPDTPFTPTASPAAVKAVESGNFRDFAKAETAATLEKRDGKPSTTPADSSPAKPVSQAGSTEPTSPPASEPGTQKPPRKGKDADSRVQELLAERAQLRRELELAKQPIETKPADSSPAPAVGEEFPDYPEYLQTHPNATLRDWSKAHFEHLRTGEERQRSAHELAAAHDKSVNQVVESFHQQFVEVLKTDPEFLDRIDPAIANARPVQALQRGEKAGPANVIASEVMKSSVAPKLMEHFTAHPEDYARLQQLPAHLAGLPPAVAAREHVTWIIRELGKIEASLGRSATPSPQTKPVTGAPDPGTTLGSRPAAPADAAKSAVDKGDFRSAKRAWTAEAAASLIR